MNDKHFQLVHKQINLSMFWSFSPFSLHVVSFSRLSLFRKTRKFTFFQGAPTGNTFIVTITSKHHDQFYDYSPRNIDGGGLVNVIIEPLAHMRFKIFKNPSPLIHLSIVDFLNFFFHFLFLFLFLCVIVMHIYFYLVYQRVFRQGISLTI